MSLGEAALRHAERIDAFGPPSAAGLEVAAVHDIGRGPLLVKLRQHFDGLPVFRAEANIVMNRGRELVAISGHVSPHVVGARARIAAGLAPLAAAGTTFVFDATQAVRAAYTDLGVDPAEITLAEVRGNDELYLASASGPRVPSGPAQLRRVLYPADERLVAGYHVEAAATGAEPGELEAYAYVISAEDGRVLFRLNRILTAEPFSYRTFARDGAGLPVASSPFCPDGSPHPTGTPDGYQPTALCEQRLLTLAHGGLSNGDPWLPEDATFTAGNNVDAYYNACLTATGRFATFEGFQPELGDFRAPLTAPRTFDFTYDHERAPLDPTCLNGSDSIVAAQSQIHRKIVHGFVLANLLHDLTYDHGFNEAAGNMQARNHRRGGFEDDRLEIVVGYPGTFAWVRPDGMPSFVFLGPNSFSTLKRDTLFDLSVFAHEWMHVMQHRLVGDANGLANHQGSALAEGWSDFFGLMLTVRAGQDRLGGNAGFGGVYPLGGYTNTSYCFPRPCSAPSPGADQSWYFGIRRYPFTTDLAKNPLTFRFIANDVPLPEGIPHTFWKGRIDNAEGHSAGEIWASALWHAYAALLRDPRYDFATAEGRMLDYLIGGMKVTPIDPTFTEARDAILAVVAATDATDHQHFKEAFAARGMGAGAISPPRDSIEFTEVRESFAVDGPGLALLSASFDEGAAPKDGDGVVDVGETGLFRLLVRNTGYLPLSAVSLEAQPTLGATVEGTQAVTLSLAPGMDRIAELPFSPAAVGTHAEVAFDVGIGDVAAGVAPALSSWRFRVNYDTHQTSFFDDAATAPTFGDWTVSGFNGQRGFGYPSRDHAWRRTPVADGWAYHAPSGKASYESTLSSRWLLLPAHAPLTIRFDHAYSFEESPGAEYGFGEVTISDSRGTTLGSAALFGVSPAFPALQPTWLTVAPAPYERSVRLSFLSWFFDSLLDVEGGIWIDNVQVQGTITAPFSTIVPDGAAAPVGSWPPRAGFELAVRDLEVRFTNRSEDPDGALVSMTWDFADGTTSSETSPTHVFSHPGEYWVSLTVRDDSGALDVAAERVRPIMPLLPRVPYVHGMRGTTLFRIDVGPHVKRLSITTEVAAGFVEVLVRHGEPVGLAPNWRFDHSNVGDLADPPIVVEIEDPAPGQWHLAVLGMAGSIVADVHPLARKPPVPRFIAKVDGLSARFEDRSEGEGEIVGWAWAFGDGATSSSRHPTHRYAAAGSYEVSLSVTDDAGLAATYAETIALEDSARDGLGCSATSTFPADAVTLILTLLAAARWRSPGERQD